MAPPVLTTTCPYCQHPLDTPPKARRKCPSCGAWIYRRWDAQQRGYQLVTADEAKRIDEARQRQFEQETRREADRRWGELNQQLAAAMKANDWSAMGAIYFEQAMQLWQEGKPFFHIAQQARRAELRGYAGSVEHVEVATANEASCPACRVLKGKKWTVDQALNEMPIPASGCTTDVGEFGQQQGWCRCIYIPVIESK